MSAVDRLPQLSRIGLGTWAMGGAGWRYSWGRQDDAVSLATIERALELGIDWIDTAPVYGVGHAEELLGRALAGRRHRVTLATKCGFLWQPGSRRPYPRLDAASVRTEVTASLRRLRTDYIDLYQIHWPGPNCDIDAAWEAIERLRDQGLVRAGGVCNLQLADLQRLHRRYPVASLQAPLNLLDDTASAQLLPFCVRHGVRFLAYSPLASGILSHGFDARRRRRLPGDDWRDHAPAFNEPQLSANLALADGLRALADRYHRRAEHYALRWVLQEQGATATILGARRPEQVSAALAATQTPLAEAERTAVARLLACRQRQLS